ncbi:uncharacterized protein LOC123914780 [Trifolium pratense]|uniref:uncharacterized protein LOC123914780 n=1 Tax=Trifolium pratense TaxID=57577 RepID=UPI001E694ECF|nr:uncharacterized protein LOC123914780 [Trifolium pratense]
MECKNAKEMWTTLQTHHEGTSHIKETRIDIGVRKFELFEMSNSETIDQMYGRFTVIINELNSLGKKYTTHERIRKLLRCLPEEWRHIVTAITVAKDLKTMDLEDFIGSLKAHEAILQEKKPANNKMIALESQVKENLKREMTCDEENPLQQDDEEEMAFLSRRIQRLMMRRNQIKNSFPPRRNETDLSQVKCYGCNQTGHYKNECPKLKQRKPPYNKSMMATWDDLEELPEEEEANVCLMTRTNFDEVNLEPCSSCMKTEQLFDNLLYDSQITAQKYDQLKNELTEIIKERDEYKFELTKVIKEKDEYETKNKTLKDTLKRVQNDLDKVAKLSKEEIIVQQENLGLKQNISLLEKDIAKYVKATETFENILGVQQRVIDKNGIGFKTHQTIYDKVFLPKKDQKVKKLFCSFCHKHGHIRYFCFKKRSKNSVRDHSPDNLQNWSQRNAYTKPSHKRIHFKNTNQQGPKSIWVPKVLLNSNTGMYASSQEKAMVLGQWLLEAHDWRQTQLPFP